jgi:hypothetical protein
VRQVGRDVVCLLTSQSIDSRAWVAFMQRVRSITAAIRMDPGHRCRISLPLAPSTIWGPGFKSEASGEFEVNWLCGASRAGIPRIARYWRCFRLS